jgi:hypothetical protein
LPIYPLYKLLSELLIVLGVPKMVIWDLVGHGFRHLTELSAASSLNVEDAGN